MNFLKHLNSKEEVEEVIQSVKNKVVILRFGRDNEIGCMELDDVLSRSEELLSNMAVICAINMDDVPYYVRHFDVVHIPASVFLFNTRHIKVDSGMSDYSKVIGPLPSKQDLIDLVEVVFRGAMRGKFIVKSPIDRRRMSHYEHLYKGF